jgi:hypothetical protein
MSLEASMHQKCWPASLYFICKHLLQCNISTGEQVQEFTAQVDQLVLIMEILDVTRELGEGSRSDPKGSDQEITVDRLGEPITSVRQSEDQLD